MNPRFLIPLSLFIAGAAAVVAAVAVGEAEVSLFLVFPVFSGSSGLFLLGVGLIVLGILAGFAMMFQGSLSPEADVEADGETRSDGRVPEKKLRTGGVLLIGPIPIAYGSDARIAMIMLALAAFVATVVILLLVLT